MTTLRGCIPILCTPFRDDLSIDLESLDREVEWVIAAGASGVAALAIAGEGYKLTDEERDLVAHRVVETVAGRMPVVVSADGGGTSVALDRARRAESLGADALMVLPPSFVAPDIDGLYAYYREIGEAVSIPIVIQDAPQLTGVPMPPALWARLAADVQTIRYVKAEGIPQGPVISETIRIAGDTLEVFCGWGGVGALDAFERGALGSMPAPNFTPLFAETQALFVAGDRSEATARFHRDLPFVVWSMQSIDYSVVTAKEALRRQGVFSAATVRPPYRRLDEISLDQLDRWLSSG
jgi:2-keto-3-deoxy-L-arabinonate dehydratase